MPADLYLTGHTHETKLAGFAQRQPITGTKVGREKKLATLIAVEAKAMPRSRPFW
ncbi:MAG: hypothetical protein J2P51_02665 [Hyphomicrobiaceae bacterium]|nr:hypothetical protein [Hyphomicrobiaceae bacterium]